MHAPIFVTTILLVSISVTSTAQIQSIAADSTTNDSVVLASLEKVIPNIEAEKNGIITSYHESGKRAAVGEYVAGIKVGEWQYFNKAETLIEKGNHVDDQKHGQWYAYHDNGVLKSIGWYKKGNKNGAWGTFYDNGTTMQGEVWKEGKLVSITEFYALDGDVLPRGTLREGNGNRFLYNKSRKLIEICNYEEGVLHGTYEKFYSNGKTELKGDYEMGQKTGEWEQYDRKGVLLEEEAN